MKNKIVILNTEGNDFLTFRQVKEIIHDLLYFNPFLIKYIKKQINKGLLIKFVKYIIEKNKTEKNKMFYLDETFNHKEEVHLLNFTNIISKEYGN